MAFIHKIYDFNVSCPVSPLPNASLSLPVAATLGICQEQKERYNQSCHSPPLFFYSLHSLVLL